MGFQARNYSDVRLDDEESYGHTRTPGEGYLVQEAFRVEVRIFLLTFSNAGIRRTRHDETSPTFGTHADLTVLPQITASDPSETNPYFISLRNDLDVVLKHTQPPAGPLDLAFHLISVLRWSIRN